MDFMRLCVHFLSSLTLSSDHPLQGIHEHVQQAALQRGILPLQRLSAAHLRSVSALTGASPISSSLSWASAAGGGATGVGHAWDASLGLLGGIVIKVKGGVCPVSLTSLWGRLLALPPFVCCLPIALMGGRQGMGQDTLYGVEHYHY